MLLPSLSLIPSPLPSLYPLPWPPLTSLPSRSPSPIPPMPTQPQIRPRQLIWLPVGAAWSHQAPEKLMPPKICAPADAGACHPAISNGWGCDPHLRQMPLLTVVRAGGSFGGHVEPGSGRMRHWRAPQTAGKLALQRRTPQHAAAPLTHAPTPSQHLPQLPPTTSTNTHQRWPWWGCGESATTTPWPIHTPHNPPTHSPPHATHTHCMHVHTQPHSHTLTCTPCRPPGGNCKAPGGGGPGRGSWVLKGRIRVG